MTAAKLAEGVAVSSPPGPAGPAGPEGPKGDPGPSTGPAGGDLSGSYPNPSIGAGKVTAPKLATIEARRSGQASLEPGEGRTVLAKCSGGERAISGGFTSNLGGSARLAVSHRTSFSPTLGVFLDAWEVRLFNGGGSEGKFEVFVYCLEA